MAEETKGNGADAPKGNEFVDFSTASPDEIEDRFKRVYGHMKDNERVIRTLADHNKKLAERLDQIETEGKRATVLSETEQIKHQIKQARDQGNHDAEIELVSKLARLQGQRIQAPQPIPAVEVPSFDVSVVTAWQNEVDPDGNFRRPWAQPTHPKFSEALRLTQDLMPQYDGDVETLLKEVDGKMGLKTKKGDTPAVLSGREGRRIGRDAGQLTPEQKTVAAKLGISEEAYSKQVKLLRGEAA